MEEDYKRKYEDLVDRLYRATKDNDVCDDRYCVVIADLVPEIRDFEDEKIRKELLSFCQNRADNYPNDPKYGNIGNWIAWLERQRTTWKPSKGQLECLDVTIDKVDKDHSPFFTNRAYLTLKALKKQLEQL